MNLSDGIPFQFRNKPMINALLCAFDDEFNELLNVFEQLRTMRTFNNSVGKQLDGIGDLVVMSRRNATDLIMEDTVLDDDSYRLILKYKSLKNTTDCTFEKFCDACELIYNTSSIHYRELLEYPATMFVDMEVPIFIEHDIELLANAGLIIKPAGVDLRAHVYEKDNFFGFIDINSNAKGFGVGKFAIDCSKGGLVI